MHKRVECTFLWQLRYWSGSGRHDLLLVFVHSLGSGKVQKKPLCGHNCNTPQIFLDNNFFFFKLWLIIGHHLKALYYTTCIQNMQFLWWCLPVIAKAWGVFIIFLKIVQLLSTVLSWLCNHEKNHHALFERKIKTLMIDDQFFRSSCGFSNTWRIKLL